ncbi:MAG: amidohydrolase family protein [Aeromicrobium sp.]
MFELIDAHTHTQPSTAATRAFLERIGKAPDDTAGDVADLLGRMTGAGIAHAMIVPWLPAQDLVDQRVAAGGDRDIAVDAVVREWRELNEWATAAVAAHPGRLSCLVGVDPVLMGSAVVAEEVSRRLADGAIGVKIAPMSVRRPPTDPDVEIVWQLAREHGVFVLSECGDLTAIGRGDYGHPRYFGEVLAAYPDVTIQLAHLGMGAEDTVAGLTETYANVCTDTSLRLGGPRGLPPDEVASWIRRIGSDRVLFGTNYPIVDPAEYAAALRSLPLSPADLERVAFGNAARLYGWGDGVPAA